MIDTAPTKSPAVANRPDSHQVTGEILAGQGLSAAQAARMIPPKREDRPVSPATVFRWMTTGVSIPGGGGRLLLECSRIGCTLFTSRPALMRFIEAQNQPRPATPAPTPPEAAPDRRRPLERASQDLQAVGI